MPTDEEVRAYNKTIIEQYRTSNGQVEGMDFLLLLRTVGARSGKSRTCPLAYSTDGDRLIVIAAFLGSPYHPDWYRNLVVNPDVVVELGNQVIPMRATVAKDEEQQRLLQQHVKSMPVVLEYQEKTSREFPVDILERLE